MPRFEDLRLVRGAGRYSDDISMPGQAIAAFVRSPHAHAIVKRIDAAAARTMPGVIAVLTGADYVADGLKGALQRANPAGATDIKVRAFAPEKRPVLEEQQFPFALDRVRYPGEAVAVVVAEKLFQARDAAEAVEVEYEVRRAVTDLREADGAETIWASAPDNIALDQEFGDAAAVQAAFDAADLIVKQTFRNQRIANAQMEPRSGVAAYDAATESYTLISGNQGVHVPRMVLAESFGLPLEKVRFVCPDVGGGFGLRNNLYPEQAAILWASKCVGRPVKWTNDRSESFLTDYAGRDLVTTARLALRDDGRIAAYDVDHIGTCGGQTVTYVPLSNAYRVATTVYDIPLMHVRCRSVMTNTVPTAPFRGAGRPEATLVLERLIDLAAGRLGMDRLKIRQKNVIPKKKLPYRTASGLLYDSGDFAGNMKRMIELADWKGFTARKRESKKRGKLRGIGISNYLETPVGIPHERVEVTVLATGKVELAVGTQSTGQGHETSFAQVMADLLGVHPEDIVFIGGDTAKIPSGSGTHSDRSMRLGGTLMVEAATDVVALGLAVAAKILGVAGSRGFLQRRPVRDAEQQSPADRLRCRAGDERRLYPRRRQDVAIQEDVYRPHTGLSDRLRNLRGRDRSRHRHRQHSALRLDRRRRTSDQSADPAWPGARRHRAGHRSGAGRGGALRRKRPGPDRQLHGLRRSARRSGAVIRHRADRGPDRRQSATGQGRRRGRHYAGARSGDERHHGRAERSRHRTHGHAGNAGAYLERDPGGEEVNLGRGPYSVFQGMTLRSISRRMTVAIRPSTPTVTMPTNMTSTSISSHEFQIR